MKKQFRPACLLTALFIIGITGCKGGAKNNSAQQSAGLSSKVSIAKERTPVVMTLENNVASFESMTNFFKPDYATETPEQSEDGKDSSSKNDGLNSIYSPKAFNMLLLY